MDVQLWSCATERLHVRWVKQLPVRESVYLCLCILPPVYEKSSIPSTVSFVKGKRGHINCRIWRKAFNPETEWRSQNLQTFSSAFLYCQQLVCHQLQCPSSPSPSPGGHLQTCSCEGMQPAPGSGKRATGIGAVPLCSPVRSHRLPPCHLPNATALLDDDDGGARRKHDEGRKKKTEAQTDIWEQDRLDKAIIGNSLPVTAAIKHFSNVI